MYPEGRQSDSGELGWKIPGLYSSKVKFPPGCSVKTQGADVALNCKESYADVQFVSDMVDHIMSNSAYAGAIDRSRVYLFGFSNGGQLALASLCLHSSRYRGFAAVGIAMTPELADVCGNPSASLKDFPNVPLREFSGLGDLESYGISSPSHRTRPVLTMNGTKDCHSPDDEVDATTSLLVRLNGAVLLRATLREAEARASAESTTSEQVTTWVATAPNASGVKHYTILNGDHSVPSYNEHYGRTACPDTGPCTHDHNFSGTTAVWTYWNETAGLNVP